MSTIELELSEEEKAELMASLVKGMSESTMTCLPSSKSVSLKKEKKHFKGPPIPVNRDGMGRYVPKHGEKPLSQCDVPGPGPATYDPVYSVVQKKMPEHSLAETISSRGRKKRHPGPDKYDVSRSMVWGKCKRITLKQRLPEKVFDPSPGPAAYSAGTLSTGHTFSIRKKPINDNMPGLISSLAYIPDPSIPGPNIGPDYDEWLQRPQTFGTKNVAKVKRHKYPGPTSYAPKVEKRGPSWHIGAREKTREPDEDAPGPLSYEQRKVDPGPAYTMRPKIPEPKVKHPTPAPNHYNAQGFDLREPGYTLQYRWYETKKDKAPGPGSYKCDKDPGAPKQPSYSIKAPWPKAKEDGIPGPGAYNVKTPGRKVGKSFGLRLTETSGNGVPGPSDYNAESTQLMKKAPVYSLTSRNWRTLVDEDAPGPSSYHIVTRKSNTGRSIGGKHDKPEPSYGPGPAPELVGGGLIPWDTGNKCDQSRGATVKGRHTPNKHLGLATKLRDPPRGVRTPPLLG